VLEKQRILLTDLPDEYIVVGSGLGEARPRNVIVLPVLFEGEVKAIIELSSFYRFNDIHLNFLDQLTESIGIVLNTISASMRTEELLKQSQSLAEELRSQQTELTETNKRLEQQALTLQASEERLKQQQEELQQTNEELEERSQLLQVQKAEVERKNREIQQAKIALEDRAQQLALASKYKSEFLANMSHELRTPLNSLLILAKLLGENPDGNLSGKQIEYARTIHSAGADLLSLINDILDLSKIESGTMQIDLDQLPFTDLRDYVERTFREMATQKGLTFDVELSPDLPSGIFTDPRRLQQIVKNLLANAFKFTEQGRVVLRAERVSSGWNPDSDTLQRAESVIALSVIDTGIGIAPAKQKIIFEAFQQADGTTSRRYGGTGLGLSISRELTKLLGGEIRVKSTVGEGSTFTLYVPQTYVAPLQGTLPMQLAPVGSRSAGSPLPVVPAVRSSSQTQISTAGASGRAMALGAAISSLPVTPVREDAIDPALLSSPLIEDDRASIHAGDRVLLIVEDDIHFARVLLDQAREKQFKGIVALGGEAALALAKQYSPDAITLDVKLPDIDGWAVLYR
jgi:signal transduction histidine kinase